MNRIYERLKDVEYFKGKLELDEAKNCLTIVLNEFLSLEYIEGNYTACYDEGLIQSKRSTGYGHHCHITEDEEVFKYIEEFLTDGEVFIEDTNRPVKSEFFTRLKIISRKKFEKKKEKYMAKKHLRIYTATEVIKYETE